LIATASIGLLAPSGTPRPFIDQIAQATRTALAEPTYQHMLIEGGFEPILDSNHKKFQRLLGADIACAEDRLNARFAPALSLVKHVAG